MTDQPVDFLDFLVQLKEQTGLSGLIRYYKLGDDHEVLEANGMLDWAQFFEKTGSRIVKQEQIGEYWVSTVFLGLDHNFGRGPPVLFETMVFIEEDGKPTSDGYGRYCTWDEAMAGHEKVAARLRDNG